ncbi:cytochrome b5 domain-containing protein 1-like isoform X2 [Anopheles albimanus]|uniref:cytochrome b5 domain-containing protein 1-like isoform X2 n=1 Tax=Anopheles albimanus TaxID=7167 RepID=UPI0016405CE9|nr:cytochrome b5 domain-containing protein 1-like isoform X2 [Anopheles albimanus]
MASASPAARYYLPDEIVIHNDASSAWVSVHRLVIDLTPLFVAGLAKSATLTKWLLAFAGKDLSSFFHPDGTPIERTNERADQPVPVFVPAMERNPATGRRWWCDPALVVGRVTHLVCPVKIINTLTLHATEMSVCYEDTIDVVLEKYLRYNSNARQYEWRRDLAVGTEKGRLRMDRTLLGNGFFVEDFGTRPIIWLFYVVPADRSGDDTGSFSGNTSPFPGRVAA